MSLRILMVKKKEIVFWRLLECGIKFKTSPALVVTPFQCVAKNIEQAELFVLLSSHRAAAATRFDKYAAVVECLPASRRAAAATHWHLG